MDTSDVGLYRPISNLSVLSKLFEHVVAGQIWNHLQRFDLLPPTQSGFRPGFSTETAILRVMSDILAAVDRGDFAALLDLSTAFHTVDHAVLLERLRRSFGFSGVALAWQSSYLSRRKECVQPGSCRSSMTTLVCGVPQGSVLGQALFIYFVGIFSTHKLVFSLPEADVYIAAIELTDVKPYKYKYCSSCTPPIYHRSSRDTVYKRTCTPMTLRFMARVWLRSSELSSIASQSASTRWLYGCDPVVYK
jgi:Reverse transcriptase (RNA-dependent DNA polymerase)